jgi:rubrerythrin
MIENLTVGRAVEFAITTEQLGQDFYKRLTEKYADDNELSDLFAKLARDEEIHEAQFRELRDSLGTEEQRELEEGDSQYLRSISTAEIFYGNNDPLSAADSVSDREDALKLAHNLEKSTLLYYHSMKEALGQSDVLDRIIAMEKKHLAQVIKYMTVSGSKMRGLSDTWT